MKLSVYVVLGLVFEMGGALMICLGAFRRTRHIGDKTPMWERDVFEGITRAKQTADTQAGALLLIVGFFFQLLSAMGMPQADFAGDRRTRWGVLLIVGLLVLALYIYSLRRGLRPELIRKSLAERLQFANKNHLDRICVNGGESLRVPRRQNDHVDEYMKRLLGEKLYKEVSKRRGGVPHNVIP